jgi:hypothetical protein
MSKSKLTSVDTGILETNRRDLTLKVRNANDTTEVKDRKDGKAGKDGWALVSLRSEIGHKAGEEEGACFRACETMLAGPIA